MSTRPDAAAPSPPSSPPSFRYDRRKVSLLFVGISALVALLAALVALACLSRADLLADQQQQQQHAPELHELLHVHGAVPVLDWSPSKPFTKKIAAQRVPVVLRNTVASRWRAVSEQRWSAAALAATLGANHTLRFVKRGSEPVFVLRDPSKPIKELPEVLTRRQARQSSYAMLNMSVSEFLLRAPTPDGEQPTYQYYSGPVEHWGADAMRDIEPRKMLEVPAVPGVAGGAALASSANVWIGHAGVTANTHYDRSHNFFVQLSGPKRWLLIPPTEWRAMYLYPALSPHYHQSQIDMDEPDNMAAFARFHNVSVFEANLVPGDVLYVPPFWFHRVTSVNFSVSVSVVSASEEELLWQAAYWTAVPFRNEWPQRIKTWAVQRYVCLLSSMLYSPSASQRRSTSSQFAISCEQANVFVADAFHERFVHFASSYGSNDATDATAIQCTTAPTELERLDAQNHQALLELRHVARNVTEHLAQLPVGVLEIGLADIVEELAAWAVSPRRALRFFRDCFPLWPRPEAPPS